MKVLVFAGTAYEARAWADDLGLRPRDYTYVASSVHLLGRSTREQPRAFVGSFDQRRDAGEIRQHLAISDLVGRYRPAPRAPRLP